jgi:hypothetical protein
VLAVAVPIAGQVATLLVAHADESFERRAARPGGRNSATLLVAASPGACVIEALRLTPSSLGSTLAPSAICG